MIAAVFFSTHGVDGFEMAGTIRVIEVWVLGFLFSMHAVDCNAKFAVDAFTP